MAPQFTSDFQEKVWLLLFDKMALGTIALALGYYISRRLEGIKSREAVRKTMLERRVNTILEQWDAVRQLHWDTVAASLLEETPVSDRADENPKHDDKEVIAATKKDASTLIQRARSLNDTIRNSRNLLGKTIAEAMYGAVAADLRAAKTLQSGEGPQTFPQDSPNFSWLQGLLDAPDVEELPLVSHERTLAASRAAFLEKAEKSTQGAKT